MKTHVIRWVSSVTGSIGTGKKLFAEEAAAEWLAPELNLSCPQIDPEAIPSVPPAEPASAPVPADGPPAMTGLGPRPKPLNEFCL